MLHDLLLQHCTMHWPSVDSLQCTGPVYQDEAVYPVAYDVCAD